MLIGGGHGRTGTLPIGSVVILDPIYYDALRIVMARVFSRFCGYHADSRRAAVSNQASCSACADFGVVNKRMSSSLLADSISFEVYKSLQSLSLDSFSCLITFFSFSASGASGADLR